MQSANNSWAGSGMQNTAPQNVVSPSQFYTVAQSQPVVQQQPIPIQQFGQQPFYNQFLPQHGVYPGYSNRPFQKKTRRGRRGARLAQNVEFNLNLFYPMANVHIFSAK